MKLLISSYACAPNRGSEHAIGWTWITHAHRLGHRVWALVAPNNRDAVMRALDADPSLAGVVWLFPEVPGWPLRQGVEPRFERTYNALWQVRAARAAARLHEEVGFDALHHLTWGGIRAPTFLGSIKAPLVLGPLGGGETSPRALRDDFPLRGRLWEAARDVSNRTIAFNPLVSGGLKRAAAIFTKTPDTTRTLPRSMRAKCIDFIEVGIDGERPPPVQRPPGPPRLLFVGRFIYLKGLTIALRALAEVRREAPEARLTLVGRGSEERRLRAIAARLGIDQAVEFVPWLPQEKVFELYRSHDVLVFPSLHDSSGNAVLEALSFGLPIVCLDLGGPPLIVGSDAGVIVSTEGRDTAQVASAMADAILRLLRAPERRERLSAAAFRRAAQFAAAQRVAKFYGIVEDIVQAGSARSAA